jgi:TrmH family RNA methyltransferase
MPLEGERMLADALDARIVPEEVFHVEDQTDGALLDRARSLGAVITPVSSRVLARLSSLPSARGLVASAAVPEKSLPSLRLSPAGVAVLLDHVQDPVNVGAVIRSAEAFGAEAILVTEGSAFPFSSRALRASAASVLRIPVATRLSPDAALLWSRDQGALLVGADAHGGESPASLAGRRPLVLVIGSEGRGISEDIAPALRYRITIPLRGRVESLNAAAAAAVLLYALSESAPSGSAARISPNTSALKR